MASPPVPVVGRRIHASAAHADAAHAAPSAPTPSSAPLPGRRRPKSRISQKLAKGSAGTSQKLLRIQSISGSRSEGSSGRGSSTLASAPHRVDLCDVDGPAVAVDEQHDRQADAYL